MFQKLCYADIGNTPKQDRIKQRYEKTILTSDIHVSRRKFGRPTKNNDSHLVKDKDWSDKLLRSKTIILPFDKLLMVTSQESEEKLHEVELQYFVEKI